MKARRQKAAILRKASSLFWDKGYAKTSMRDIARVCGFKPANIYNYFKNKEEILYEVLQEEGRRLISAINHLKNDNTTKPEEQLRTLIANHTELVVGQQRTSRLLIDTELKSLRPVHRQKIIGFRDEYDKILRGVIARGIQAGDFSEINVKLAANIIASAIVRCRVWYSSKGEVSVNELAAFIADFSLNGLKARR